MLSPHPSVLMWAKSWSKCIFFFIVNLSFQEISCKKTSLIVSKSHLNFSFSIAQTNTDNLDITESLGNKQLDLNVS